jgi:hypothetical protein
MINNFKEYLRVIEEYALSSDFAGAVHNSNLPGKDYETPNIWSGNTGAQVPQHGIGLPQVNKRSKVIAIEYKHGGIAEVRLEDGTTLVLPTREFRSLGGDRIHEPDPKTGAYSMLDVTFQRHPTDQSKVMTKLTKGVVTNIPGVRTQPS